MKVYSDKTKANDVDVDDIVPTLRKLAKKHNLDFVRVQGMVSRSGQPLWGFMEMKHGKADIDLVMTVAEWTVYYNEGITFEKKGPAITSALAPKSKLLTFLESKYAIWVWGLICFIWAVSILDK